jgi:hypothetical protein
MLVYILMTTKRDNKHRQVYLWELENGKDVEEMTPYKDGVIKFKKPLSKPELADYIQKIADEEQDKTIFFSLRQGAHIWKAFKTGEEESELKALFSI